MYKIKDCERRAWYDAADGKSGEMVNGSANFEELLQWYDFSACLKKYLDFKSEE